MPDPEPVEPALPKGEVTPGVTIAGARAELRIGGYVAAELGSWTLDGTAEGWTCSAVIVRPDPYWLDYGGAYEFRIPFGRQTLVWKPVTFERAGAARIEIHGAGEPVRY